MNNNQTERIEQALKISKKKSEVKKALKELKQIKDEESKGYKRVERILNKRKKELEELKKENNQLKKESYIVQGYTLFYSLANNILSKLPAALISVFITLFVTNKQVAETIITILEKFLQ